MDLSTVFILAVALVVAAYIIKRFFGFFLGLCVCFILMHSCSRADELRFEISAIAETSEDRAAVDEAVSHAARILRSQFDIDLVVIFHDIGEVAQHTHAGVLLDAVKFYRFERTEHRAADATVLFTRRTLTRGYQGIATIGPACSASSAAVVTIRSDGYDGQILAHELLHTLGVPHDHAAGWLMSEALSRAGSDYASPDTVLTVKAAPLAECMAKPAASSGSPVSVPVGTREPTGGGGAVDVPFAIVLLLLGAYSIYMTHVAQRNANDAHEARLASVVCATKHAPEYSLRDIVSVTKPVGKNLLVITFASFAGVRDFEEWLGREHRRAKNESGGVL